jgi:tetratricopeptide (TPR) repeat protein
MLGTRVQALRGSLMALAERNRIMEWALVGFAICVGYFFVETGYRVYLFYTYAVEAEYDIVTVDAMEPRINIHAPGNVTGPYPTKTVFSKVYYNGKNKVIYRNKVHTNNLGWTSRYSYSRTKAPGEYRIAVIGGSTTAAESNELAWTDVLQDRLNSDNALLDALEIRRFSILNLGLTGSGMANIAISGGSIARRFSPDLIVVNFSIENVVNETVGEVEFKAAAAGAMKSLDFKAEQDWPADQELDYEVINEVKIKLYCPRNQSKSFSNPNCVLSPAWYISPGRELTEAEVRDVKRAVAQRRLLHTVLLSPRPLALLEILGRPVIPRAQAAQSALTEQQREKFAAGMRALDLIRQLQPHLLLTHNPHLWHMTRKTSSLIDELIDQIRDRGFNIIQMAERMPFQLPRESNSWYIFDGHWSDRGAEAYGNSIYGVIRERLLAERGIASDVATSKCAIAFAGFRRASAALAKGEQTVGEKELDAAVHALPPNAMELAKRSGTNYADCGFVGELHRRRAALFEGRGESGLADPEWQAALMLAEEPFQVYEQRAGTRNSSGNIVGAIEDLSEVIRLKPGAPSPYVSRGELRLKSNDPAGALADFEAAREFGGLDLALRFRLSQARWMLGDYAAVVSETSAGLKEQPTNGGFLVLRAAAEERLDQLDQALADYSAAIELGPNSNLYMSRANVLERLGQRQQAEKDRAAASRLQ